MVLFILVQEKSKTGSANVGVSQAQVSLLFGLSKNR